MHGRYKQMELYLKFPLLETAYLNEDNNKKMPKVSFLKLLFTLQHILKTYFEDAQALPDILVLKNFTYI